MEPGNFVTKWQTPQLVITSEGDYAFPIPGWPRSPRCNGATSRRG